MPRVFYRVIWGPQAAVEHFLSAKAKNEPPPADPALLSLYDGLSMYNTEQQARNKALDLNLGDHIAVVELPDNAPVRWERTLSSRGHHTVWGDAAYLHGCVVSVVQV